MLGDDIEYLYLDGITAKLRQLGIEGKVMLLGLGVNRDVRTVDFHWFPFIV